jgi:hypothetical protein
LKRITTEKKRVDYIIIKDDIYAASDAVPKMLLVLPRFKDSVSKRGYARARVKCHGKNFFYHSRLSKLILKL